MPVCRDAKAPRALPDRVDLKACVCVWGDYSPKIAVGIRDPLQTSGAWGFLHIYVHTGLQNDDARGDPNGLSVEERVLGRILSTPTLEHALVAMENLQDSHNPDVFQNKESTKIAQEQYL